MDIKIYEAQQIKNMMNPSNIIPRYIIIKLLKVKDIETILKSEREKQVIIYKGAPIRQSVDSQ